MNTNAARFTLLTLAFLAVSVVAARTACGQDGGVFRPADTSSPQTTLRDFIDACNRLYRKIETDRFHDRTSSEHRPLAMRVLDCIDQSELPEFERLEAAGEAAICLKEILDRVEIPPDNEIPDQEAIESSQDDRLMRYQIPGTRITIARVEEGPQRHEYLFTPGTVARALEYYQDIKSAPYRTTGPDTSPGFYDWYMTAPGHPRVAQIVDWLPDWFRQRVGGLAYWKWIGIFLTVIVAVALMVVCYLIHDKLARKYRDKNPLLYLLTIVFPILAAMIPIQFKDYAYDHLTLRSTALYVVSFFSNMIALFALIFVVFGATSRLAAVIIASPRINPQGLNAQLIRIMTKLLSLVLAVLVLLEGGNYLGIPVTTLMASAGIGGLAVALGAQDTLKTLFGTVMLLSDKPFRVGERIIFGKYDGVVEDIGLRSTRIRLLTGHQATIPNDELARSDIENVGRRPFIRRVADIHIPLDTEAQKLEAAVDIIRAALQDHEGMDPDYPPRVYFFDFNPAGFIIRIIYWYKPAQYWDYLAMGEQINFQVCRAFEEQGISFSLPFRVTYTSLDSKTVPIEIQLPGNQAA